jgi:heavy metal translocating P-type ATPase
VLAHRSVLEGMKKRLMSTRPPIAAHHSPRHIWTRANALPLSAAAFLMVGAVAWLVGRAGHVPNAGTMRDRIWYAGLLLTGVPVIWRTLHQAMRGHFATDLVAMLAVAGAVILDEPLAGLLIVLMQTGGEALERYAEGRASAAVQELEAAAPRLAHRIRDGSAEDLPAESVSVDDVLLIRPGELVPCDAVVLDGHSAVDVSRLTGEPIPLDASAGTPLPSGSGNGEGPLTVRATAVASESQYARIVQLVRTAQASKAPLQRLADRYAIWFTPATLFVCAIAWLWSGDPRRALAVLVVATPCPLILATPIAIIGGINRAAKRQVIVRHGGALEQIGATTTAIFDKTGTLTMGRPDVERVVVRGKWSQSELLRLAGGVEQGSGHLLARTLVAAAVHAAGGGASALPHATRVVDAPGRGVTGWVEGHEVTVGARGLLSERYPAAVEDLRTLDAHFASDTGLRAYVAIDGEVVGAVQYADGVRDDARAVVDELRQLGVRHLMLLSGDGAANVRAVAQVVGLSDARANLLPGDKAAIVRDLEATGERVLMVGDGTNDAPAMSSATVGVSLAAHGGGITAEAADIVVLADELSRVPEAIRISRRTMRIARQSLALGLGLSGLAMLFALFGFIQPPAGALLQELIDVAAIMNALRTSRPDAARATAQRTPEEVSGLQPGVVA